MKCGALYNKLEVPQFSDSYSCTALDCIIVYL